MSTAVSTLIEPRSPRATALSDTTDRHLRPLDRPAARRRPRLVYAITAVSGALLIAGAQLGFSLLTTQTTYEIRDLTEKQRALALDGQALYDQVAGLSSPQYLASNATAAGLIIGGAPTYLRLSDGAVSGAALAVTDGSIDAARTAVPNQLISNTPLVTNPDLTISGKTVPQVPVVPIPTGPLYVDTLPTPVLAQAAAPSAPVAPTDVADTASTDSLPTPQTR